MDLLPVPQDPTWPTAPSPDVCGDDHWDGGAFLSFPKRSGKIGWLPYSTRSIAPELECEVVWTGAIDDPPWPEVQVWLQKWLFFGLIAEFLGLNEQEDGTRAVDDETARRELATLHATHTTRDETGALNLTGLVLMDLVPIAFERARASNEDLTERFLPQMEHCMRVTNVAINWDEQIKADSLFYLGINALGSFITRVIQVEISRLNGLGPKVFHTSRFAYYWQQDYLLGSTEIQERMVLAGWCISDIARAQRMYATLGTLHFLSRFRKNSLGRDHSACTENNCVSAQIKSVDYVPSHATSSCTCEHIDFDISKVCAVLEAGRTYPVLRFVNTPQAGSKISLLVEEASSDIPYVALSHVWADGLGNPHANSIPACQITRLAAMVRDVEIRNRSPQEIEGADVLALHELDDSELDMVTPLTEYRLWIDTLCCPVQLDGKRIALGKMPEVYRNAAHVLVLDSSVYAHTASSLDPAEMNMLIWACSAWMRRLWTLQEGALASSVWFRFADLSIRVEDAATRLWNFTRRDPRYGPILESTLGEYGDVFGIRQDRPGNSGLVRSREMLLYTVQRCVFHRNVSVALDETVCLSTLLGLEGTHLLESNDHEERVIRFWQLYSERYGGIPRMILFSPDDTCERAGWRWAPRSLINPRMNGYDEFRHKCRRFVEDFGPNQIPYGAPTHNGLRVQMPGQLIRTRSLSSVPITVELLESLSIERDPSTYYESPDNTGDVFSFTTRADMQSAGELARSHTQIGGLLRAERTGRRYALIPSPDKQPVRTKSGLLVEILNEFQETADDHLPEEPKRTSYQVHPLHEVLIYHQDPKSAACYLKVDEMARQVVTEFEEVWIDGSGTIGEAGREAARADIKRRLVETMARAMDEDEDFKDTTVKSLKKGFENAWENMLRSQFLFVTAVQLPEDQVWYFD